MSVALSKSEKDLESRVYEKRSESKIKFLCPVHGKVDGLQEVYVNSLGAKVLHDSCSVCGWVKTSSDSKVDEGKRKPVATLVCHRCKQEFFGKGREVIKDYENHLKQHILEDVKAKKVEYDSEIGDILKEEKKGKKK